MDQPRQRFLDDILDDVGAIGPCTHVPAERRGDRGPILDGGVVGVRGDLVKRRGHVLSGMAIPAI
jgi:hypothetical protein